MSHRPLPAGVQVILSDLSNEVRAVLGSHFTGLYLYGSLALGDFDPRRSDIDFLVVTQDEISQPVLAELTAMHLRIAAGPSKWARELEGSYIPRAALRRYQPAAARHPHIDRGSGVLRVEQHHSDWIIQRHVLREHGLTLDGPPARSLIDPVSPDELRQAVRDLLWWWELQLKDTRRIENSAYQAYAVLSMCRILYTMETGAIASKPHAARWAVENYPAKWSVLIQRAVLWQPHEPLDCLEDTLAWIRFTLAKARK